MLNRKFLLFIALMMAVRLFIMQGSALAYDITDKFSVGGIRITAEF